MNDEIREVSNDRNEMPNDPILMHSQRESKIAESSRIRHYELSSTSLDMTLVICHLSA